jgi:hypothetical protein
VQVAGVFTLGVQGVGDDEVPGEVGDHVQDVLEHGDLVALDVGLALGGNGFRVVSER